MRKVTESELMQVLQAMNKLDPERKGIGPTQIGLALGLPYETASSWTYVRLHHLVKRRWVEKLSRGLYRVVRIPEDAAEARREG